MLWACGQGVVRRLPLGALALQLTARDISLTGLSQASSLSITPVPLQVKNAFAPPPILPFPRSPIRPHRASNHRFGDNAIYLIALPFTLYLSMRSVPSHPALSAATSLLLFCFTRALPTLFPRYASALPITARSTHHCFPLLQSISSPAVGSHYWGSEQQTTGFRRAPENGKRWRTQALITRTVAITLS